MVALQCTPPTLQIRCMYKPYCVQVFTVQVGSFRMKTQLSAPSLGV
jgi:hypothetical protein